MAPADGRPHRSICLCPDHRDEAVLHREHGGSRPAGDSNLVVDMLDVVSRRPGRDVEALANLSIGVAVGYQTDDVDLSVCEARWSSGDSFRGRATSCVDDRSHRIRIQSPRGGLAPHLVRRLVDPSGLAVRATLHHCLHDVCGGKDSYRHGDLAGLTPAMVARPVQSFVVHPSEGRHRLEYG